MKKMKIFKIFFGPLLGVGNEWIGPKNISKKEIFEKNEKNTFQEAIYQLKNTSDCIKIDPPGPGRNLKKKWKIEVKMLVVKKIKKESIF